jgi:hypothetical protein
LKKIICLVLFVRISIFSADAQAVNGYYTLFDGKLDWTSGDSENAPPPREWQIRLYRKNENIQAGAWPGGFYGNGPGKNYWGSITTKTSAEAENELKKCQDDERVYCKNLDCIDTFFNPFGPIAIYDKTGANGSQTLQQRVDDVNERFDKLHKVMEELHQLFSSEAESQRPFQNTGKVLKSYTDNFKDVFKKQKELRILLSKSNVLRENEIINNLNNFSHELEKLEVEMTKNAKQFPKKNRLLKNNDGSEGIREQASPRRGPIAVCVGSGC